MSSNLDLIATVDISLDTPVSNGASFDNILILGPGPENPVGEIPTVGVYRSLGELTELGFCASGDKADPVGVAARAAFSQSPAPGQIYIAVQKPTAEAIAAAETIRAVNTAIEQYAGEKEDLTGCSIAFSEQARRIDIVLSGPVSGVKNTGLFDMLGALAAQGYTASVDGTALTDGAAFKKLPVFKTLAALKEGGDDVLVPVAVNKQDTGSVTYAVVVSYPDPDAPETAENTVDQPLDSPETELEPPVETLERAMETDGWYCICPAGVDGGGVKSIIEWTETQNKICGYIEGNPDSPIVESGIYLRSYAVYPKVTEDQSDDEVPAENRYGAAAAMAVKAMNYHAGEETWALKSLSAITPSRLSLSFIQKLNDANISFISNIASKNVVLGGKTSGGEWIDVIRFRDWLQNDMQSRVVNLLIINPKIPYTDGGIGLVENQMLASLKDGQKYGGIAPTEYDADGNTIPGYATSVPLAADLTGEQKASRTLTGCRFSARLAGAVHLAEIEGSLTYEKV